MSRLDDLIPDDWQSRSGRRNEDPDEVGSDADRADTDVDAFEPVALPGAHAAEPAAPPSADAAVTASSADQPGAGASGAASTRRRSRPGARRSDPRSEGQHAAPRRRRLGAAFDGPAELRRFLELFGLCGLVVAQPLLEIYGKSPDVLVNVRLSAVDTVAFAATLVLVPPIVLWALTWPLALISPRVELVVHRVVLAVLGGLFVAQLANGSTGMVASWVLGALTTAAMLFALLRWSVIERWLRFLSPAPILFLALFLFASGATPLIFSSSSATASAASFARPRSVVFVLFDELPTMSLLDGSGRIDDHLFPNFAQLQRESTWFRNATTPATFTTQAVPSLLTGKIAVAAKAPVSAVYPDNIFTLFAGQYRMNVLEDVTSLCPASTCSRFSGEQKEVLSLLGQAGSTWAERFGEKRTETNETGATTGFDDFIVDHDPRRVDQFIDQIQADGGRPSLNFIHEVLPHFPFEFTPEGFRYDYAQATGTLTGIWSDPQSAASGRLRHLLQTQYVDRLLGRIVASLKERGLWDDTMLVVAADHGIGFTPGESMRGVGTGNAPEVLFVPTFVRAPGLTPGTVNDTPVSTIDLFPTIADVVGAQIPWAVDGVSLLQGGSVKDDVRRVAPNPVNVLPKAADGFVDVAGAPQYQRLLQASPFGKGDDDLTLYRTGPYASVVGQKEPAKKPSPSNTFVAVARPGAHPTVDASTGRLPAQLHGFLNGAPAESWLAIALNGTITGVVQTNKSNEFFWMLPDTRFVSGENKVDLYLLSGPPNAPELRPLPLQDVDR
ncbi:MAG: sulfatase-like hydrolase/transferase [Acidimicrobiales bacterium]